MSGTTAGWLQFALLVAALAVCYVPLGNYIAHIFTTDKDWAVERGDRAAARTAGAGRRVLMPGLHGSWSIGSFAGAGTGALAVGAGPGGCT